MTLTEELIARLEKATGPDRELDRAIMHLLGYTREGPGPDVWGPPISNGIQASVAIGTKRFTASMDAAMTLVENYWQVGETKNGFWCNIPGPVASDQFRGSSTVNAAIALCIASLKARSATIIGE